MSTKMLPGLMRERETKYKLISKQIKNQSKLIHMHVQYGLKKGFLELWKQLGISRERFHDMFTFSLKQKVARSMEKFYLWSIDPRRYWECFSSNTINIKHELKEISILDNSKATQSTNIPIKDNSNFFAEQICAYFNESISKGKFPNCWKLTNITSGFKKGARTSKNNYKPVNIFPIFSNIFEKLLPKQYF